MLGAAASGAFLLGFHAPLGRSVQAQDADSAFNAFIRIDRDGAVTLIIPQVEMGQGIYTALAMVLAEELDADWSRVSVAHAPENGRLYGNPLLGEQITGGSSSVRAFWTPMRQAGARARACLVKAAAERWGAPPQALRTEAGVVIHPASGRRLTYGALAAHAATLSPPSAPSVKSPRDFRLIGKPLRRLDTPTKTDGKARYGIDALPEGVKFATLRISPVLGGRVARVDPAPALATPGVRQVVVLEDVVAVVGDHMWAAKRGLDALDIVWDDGPNARVDTDLIWRRLREASRRTGAIARDDGDAETALAKGPGRAFTAEYEMPLLAHTCMEPLNCTVDVRADGVEVWIGTQVMTRVRAIVAETTSVPIEKVKINQHLIGGGFGRRLEADMAGWAARIAMQVKGPVKVVWTREEDVRQDYYRPAYHDILWARVRKGRITAWKHRVTGSAIAARYAPVAYKAGIDPDGVDSARDMPYNIADARVEFVREEPPGIHTGWWRGVGPNNNVFAIESFIEELARRARQDPIAFRLAHLDRAPRLRSALALAREKSGWDQPLPARCGRGVAVQGAFGSFIATVVEVAVDDHGEVRLRRVTSCVDAGVVINPNSVIAQLQGGLIYGLSAGLYGEITLKDGRVQQSNFHDYRALRIDQTPPIEVHLIPSGEAPGGIGETGTTASVAALRNAVYAATGVALRQMPVKAKAIAKGVRL
ncbi:molybdopterin cofactor-binding domain-containing protein [Caulobacter sp. 602-1]|uniref:xanthine dehydrogenase family protein molybdopterin-binding subunit n=1 Tax=Caulobacter sp. 602-1 TaxID=2492472 RepID=UPI0018F5CFC4|nr:molybdopterin cofactor-binding domain-containing protein [Caulobacter sp. 602-1]